MQDNRQHLVNSWVDASMLGGGSIVALVFIYLFTKQMSDAHLWSLSATLFLANIVNHPHFAVSYQIFYSQYKNKLFSPEYTFFLRARYFAVGIIIPIALIIFFAYSVKSKNILALGISFNMMIFLVGWHYIKQGYGMAIVDASLKKLFFSQQEKYILLINGYAIWIYTWALFNFKLHGKNTFYFSIPYYTAPIPDILITALQLIVVFTSIAVAHLVWQRFASKKPIAWAGFTAYLVSLYIWLLLRDPILVLWYPLFHSLQYLVVVSKFQKNRFSDMKNGRARLILSVAISIFLGYYFFWEIPNWLDSTIQYDKEIFGTSLFIFMFWIFINIHHYFIDTVMWRKENIDVKKYLFN